MGADGSKGSRPSTPVAADGDSGEQRGLHVGFQSLPTVAQQETNDVHSNSTQAGPRTETASGAAACLPCDGFNATPERPKTWDGADASVGGRLSEMDEIENLIVVLEHSGGGVDQQTTTGCEPRPLQPSQQTSGTARPPLPPLLVSRAPLPPLSRAEPNISDTADDDTTTSLWRSGKESGSAKQTAATADVFDPLKFKDANKSPRLHDAIGSAEIARKSTPDIVKIKSVAAKLEPQYNDDEVELLVSIERDLIH